MSDRFFQKLIKGLLKNPAPEPAQVLPKPDHILPIEDMLTELVKIPDSVWGQYAFSRDILRNKISLEEKNRLTIKANECGCIYAEQLAEKYKTRMPSIIAKALGINLFSICNGCFLCLWLQQRSGN